jgi:hypothetical protein
MEDKKIIFLVFFTVLFLFSGLLFAQMSSSMSQPGYFIDASEGELVFKQRLVWEKEIFASSYEIEIQIYQGGSFINHFSENVKNTFVEVSLHPGRYRFCVTSFDLMGRRSDTSEWEEFTVTPAYQPEIAKIVPDYFYMDENERRIVTVSGINIFDDSEIYLRNDAHTLIPINKVVTNNSSVRLTFDDNTLIPGTYEFYIKNPGGLDVSFGTFFVGYHKYLETFIKIGFNPAIPMDGELKDMFGSYMYPGVTLRIESLASERSSFKAGLEFVAAFYYFDYEYSLGANDDETLRSFIDANTNVKLLDFSINVSMQRRFNNMRNAVTFCFGFGITSYSSLGAIVREEQNGHINLGLAGLFHIYRNFYVETGLDYTYYISGKSGMIKPRVSVAWKV